MFKSKHYIINEVYLLTSKYVRDQTVEKKTTNILVSQKQQNKVIKELLCFRFTGKMISSLTVAKKREFKN